MSPNKKLAKATRPVPLEALTTDKLWPKLFSEASGYQPVLIELHRADMPHPHARVALQGPIQLFRRAVFEPTLSCALWMLDHPELCSCLTFSREGHAWPRPAKYPMARRRWRISIDDSPEMAVIDDQLHSAL